MKRSVVLMVLGFGLALATGCATRGKRSAARPIGNGPYLTEQDGTSWWDSRNVSSSKNKTYRR